MSAIFARWAGTPGPVTGLYRVGIAAAVLALPALRQARPPARLSRRHVLLAMLAGLFFAGDMAAWNTAVLITNAANATLLGNTAPIWVSLGALILFRERLGWAFWSGLALAMLGAVVILGGDFLRHPTLGVGDLLAMLAGIFYGGYLLTTQHARAGLNSLLTWWVSAVASSAALLAISLLMRQPVTGYSLAAYASLAGAALVSQLGGYLSVSYALGHLPASVVSTTLLLQPVLTAILAMPLLAEGIGWGQGLGGAIVLAGIWLVYRQRAATAQAAQVLDVANS
jgi:drug/metabolite transporter (DMT)-like permease